MTTIQVLGIEGSTQTRQLRENVLEALSGLNMKAKVEDVSEMERFLESRISGIPALVVNGTIVLQKEVPSVEDLKILLKVFSTNGLSPCALKRIMVPTDFSETAKGAFQFALEVASQQGSEVQATHVYLLELDPQNPYLTGPLPKGLAESEKRLEEFVEKKILPGELPTLKEVKVSTELLVGFPADELVNQSKTGEFDLMVMGTTGEQGFLEKLFGSVSTNVAKRAGCPVMLIPDGVRFRGFRHILYASNYESAEEPFLRRLVGFAHLFKADIHFVHVAGENQLTTYKEIEKRLFSVLFKEGEPSFAFTIGKVEDNSVEEGLNDYAMKHGVDLVVMVKPHRTFWENLFHKSVTKAMTLNTQLPILVLHD